MWTDHSWNDGLEMVILALPLIISWCPRSDSVLICVMKQTGKSTPGGQHDHGGVPYEANIAEQGHVDEGLLLHQAPCTAVQVNCHSC